MSDLIASIWPAHANRNDGVIEIANCSVSAIAERYGTPLFILDETDLLNRARKWREELETHFGKSAGTVYYAAKAFVSVEVAKLIEKTGIGLDVCTGGELAVARAAGFPGARIEMHGNNKSESEIAAALEYRVGTIVLDSLQEIERVARIAHEKAIVQDVMIRLNPGVEAHTHEFIKTAHEDVKFGFSIASGAAWDAVLAIAKHETLNLKGVHAHIGSQILADDAFRATAIRLLEFMARYRSEFGRNLSELNIGGGVGVAYVAGDEPLSPGELVRTLREVMTTECQRLGLELPAISMEPGRAIIGPTMITLYRVGTTKEVSLPTGNRLYISVDGGMSDNIRPALYGAQYSISLANRSSNAQLRDCRIVGKHCETGDIIIESVYLPSDIAPGDLLAVPATGAYGRSMASNYNHQPRPGVIAVKDGKARTILRAETEADLIALDVVETAVEIRSAGQAEES
jgi:diaminopimelate decarboxylase